MLFLSTSDKLSKLMNSVEILFLIEFHHISLLHEHQHSFSVDGWMPQKKRALTTLERLKPTRAKRKLTLQISNNEPEQISDDNNNIYPTCNRWEWKMFFLGWEEESTRSKKAIFSIYTRPSVDFNKGTCALEGKNEEKLGGAGEKWKTFRMNHHHHWKICVMWY